MCVIYYNASIWLVNDTITRTCSFLELRGFRVPLRARVDSEVKPGTFCFRFVALLLYSIQDENEIATFWTRLRVNKPSTFFAIPRCGNTIRHYGVDRKDRT